MLRLLHVRLLRASLIGSTIGFFLLHAGGACARAAAPGGAASPPDSVALWIEAAGDSAAWPGAGIVGVFDRTEVRVEPSGLGHVSRRTLTKILTEEGARSQATLRFDYDPASNMIRLDAIRVHRAGGGTESIDTSLARDHSAPADMIYWGARMKIISFAPAPRRRRDRGRDLQEGVPDRLLGRRRRSAGERSFDPAAVGGSGSARGRSRRALRSGRLGTTSATSRRCAGTSTTS